MLLIFDIGALVLTAVLCFLGVFHRSFRDNFLQCVGMAGLCFACIGRVVYLWAVADGAPAPGWVLVHLTVAIYAIGTAQKVVFEHGRRLGWRWVRRLERWHFRKTARGDFDDEPHHHFPPS